MAVNDPQPYVDTVLGKMQGAAQFYWNGTAWVAAGSSGGESGVTCAANFTPAAAAYGAGDVMSVAQAMPWTYAGSGLAVRPTSLIRVTTSVVKIDVTAVPGGQSSYTLQLYGVTPPSAQADNDLWTLASADLSSYLGAINLGTPVDLGASLYIRQQYVDFDIGLASASMFGALVTVGAHTAAAVARSVRLFGVVL